MNKSLLAVSLCTVLSVASAAGSGFDREKFRNPESMFSPGYFWMWNTKLDVSQLKSQLDDMVAHGVRSVCVHPFPVDFRPGHFQSDMSPDYLSPEYMEVFSQVIDHMEKLGMSAWLYDEGGWPSGGACGQIAKEDAAAGRFRQRFYGPGPKGKETTNRVWTQEYGEGRQNYPSMIEPGATERFIEKTHEAYRKAVGRHFGKTIKFAFMDEPVMPYGYKGESMGWCSDFAEQFRVRKGYDFMPHADDVLANKHVFDADTVKYRIDYLDVRAQLFSERFLGVVQDWCRCNGLRSSGHMDGEDIPEAAIRYGYGNLFDCYRAMDVPGVDVIWRQLYPTTLDNPGAQLPFPRYASSVGHQKGERLALSESFGIYGDSFPPGMMKWLVDYQMVRGINLFVFGYYAVSNAGQWMDLFEPHSGPVTPGWDFQRPFFDYIARTASILAEGEPTAEIAVYFDNRAFWAGGIETEVAARMHYAAATVLDRANCEYEFIDDRALADAEIVGDRMRVGNMSYSTFVLPSSRWMGEKARGRLDAFRKAGGKVLSVEEIAKARPACRIRGRLSDRIRVARRVKGNEMLYFLVNETPYLLPPMELELDGAEGVVRADPITGRFFAIDAQKGNRFNWRFPPYGSAIFITGAKSDVAAEPYFDYDVAPGNVYCITDGWTMKPLVRHKAGRNDFEIAPVADARERPTDLSDWRRSIGDDFSGKVLYRVEFDCDEAKERWLDLGVVKWCCDARFNGQPLGARFFGPYRWRVKTAKGRNILEVTVANMLCNTLGDDVRDRIARDFPPRSGYDVRQRTFDRDNNESGLFGPVTLR